MFNDVSFNELTIRELKNIFKSCNLWKVKIKKDFKEILRDEIKSKPRMKNLSFPDDIFFDKYAGKKCIVRQDFLTEGFKILSDNKFVITYECFKDATTK